MAAILARFVLNFQHEKLLAGTPTTAKIYQPNHPQANNGWVECTWHHHEDGKTLIPVPSEIHNRGIQNSVPHTGGHTILKNHKDLIGFFNSPKGIQTWK